MTTSYTLSFNASRPLTPEEVQYLTKKLTGTMQKSPFGPWKPGVPDHPTLSPCALHKEVDPLLGYDRDWLVQALMDHLRVQENRVRAAGVNSKTLTELQFALTRIDEFAGETVIGLDYLRDIVSKGVY